LDYASGLDVVFCVVSKFCLFTDQSDKFVHRQSYYILSKTINLSRPTILLTWMKLNFHFIGINKNSKQTVYVLSRRSQIT